MTPRETELMNASIRDAVVAAMATAMVPVHRRLEALEATDKKHSGTHKALDTKVRESKSDINARVDDTVEAVKHRDEQLVHALNEVRDQIAKNSIVPDPKVPIEPTKPTAATTFATKTQAIQIAADRADNQSLASKRRSTLAMIATIFVSICEIIRFIQAQIPSGHS